MITLVANPSSRSGHGRRLWPFWQKALSRTGRPHAFLETTSYADCVDKAEQAARTGDTVVAVGGDGTLNAVISGVLQASETLPGPDFGVLYAGTSPDFCRFHDLPLDPQKALETLLTGRTRPIDIAALVCRPEKGTEPRRFFASSCNIGLGAATARFANAWRRYLGDGCGTGLGLVRAILTHNAFSCRLVIDGKSLGFKNVNHMVILKNPYIASGIRANLSVSPDDGFLHVIVIHGCSRLGMLGLVRSFYSGNWTGHPCVFIRKCKALAITTTPVQAAECDGDPCGTTPVAVEVRPKALRLMGR